MSGSSKNKNNDKTEELLKDDEKKEEDSPYQTLVRSLTNRGKNKRKVKLVEDKLIQLTFGDHSDSEDDEDFTLDDADLDSDDSNYCEDDGDEDDDESEVNEAEEEGEAEEEEENSEKKEVSKPLKIGDLIKAMKSPHDEDDEDEEEIEITDRSDDEDVAKTSVKKEDAESSVLQAVRKTVFLVCGICLESESNESDEILECDNCGITVHEGCYGDIDALEDDDAASLESEAPTEPWFCEPCKAGIAQPPICELCPSTGAGIFKLTDTRKWVHLICALYTPFVGFRDVSRLQTVVLEDIKNSMWGGNECMFCEDENFARTGVCISCDAGMCRSAFHVTCGQRNGFLSDIPDKISDKEDNDRNGGRSKEEQHDLLYAHCKLHSVKHEIEKRKRSWVTFQSHVSKFQQQQQSDGETDEKLRISESLQRAKKEFLEYHCSIVQPKPPTKEYPRLLSTCPEACKLLAKKAEILGLLKHPVYNVAAAITKGRIVKHEPNMSSEFVNYFFKREMESVRLTDTLSTAEPHLNKLRKEQRILTKRSEELHVKLLKVGRDKDTLRTACERLHDALNKLCGDSGRNTTLKLPDMLRAKQAKETVSKLDETSKLLNTVVNRCAACKETTDQHMLALCDTCKQHYHLACLDPPLTRMPKKSSMYLWQCTECDSSDESSESDVEMSDGGEDGGPRRNRRRNIRQPKKFIPDGGGENDSSEKKDVKEETSSGNSKETPGKRKLNDSNSTIALSNSAAKKRKQQTPNQIKKKKTNRNTEETSKQQQQQKLQKSERQPRKKTPAKEKPPAEPVGDCCVCKKGGVEVGSADIVKCDECKQFYHFKTCLDPPYAKTPKSKFYGWICEECDESESESDDDCKVEDEGEEKGNRNEGDDVAGNNRKAHPNDLTGKTVAVVIEKQKDTNTASPGGDKS